MNNKISKVAEAIGMAIAVVIGLGVLGLIVIGFFNLFKWLLAL